MGNIAVAIKLDKFERKSLARARKTDQGAVRWACIVLTAAIELENEESGVDLGADANIVVRRRRRFAVHRLDGLLDEPGPNTPRKIADNTIHMTIKGKPSGATHCLLRSTTRTVCFASSTVQGIWRVFGLTPHRTETFELLNDLRFAEKVHEIITFYLAPPDWGVVLYVDEKLQIQALDRSQPLLPIRRGQMERRTQNGTLYATNSLIATLNITPDTLTIRFYPTSIPTGPDVHLVMGNDTTRKTNLIRGWLGKCHAGMSISRGRVRSGTVRSSVFCHDHRQSGQVRCVRIRSAALGRHPRFHRSRQCRLKTLSMTKSNDDIRTSIHNFCTKIKVISGNFRIKAHGEVKSFDHLHYLNIKLAWFCRTKEKHVLD